AAGGGVGGRQALGGGAGGARGGPGHGPGEGGDVDSCEHLRWSRFLGSAVVPAGAVGRVAVRLPGGVRGVVVGVVVRGRLGDLLQRGGRGGVADLRGLFVRRGSGRRAGAAAGGLQSVTGAEVGGRSVSGAGPGGLRGRAGAVRPGAVGGSRLR